MAQDFARAFYSSAAWKNTREAYKRSVGGLCERCEANGIYGIPGEIVHHKIHLTPENIGNPLIALAFSNLELVCRNCHKEIHEGEYGAKRKHKKRYEVDEEGHVKIIE